MFINIIIKPNFKGNATSNFYHCSTNSMNAKKELIDITRTSKRRASL